MQAKNAANESNVRIPQETWNDALVSLMCLALLTSGFSILPDSESGHGGEGNGSHESGECILTIGFQILVNNLPSRKLKVESVETINNFIAGTIGYIQSAIQEI